MTIVYDMVAGEFLDEEAVVETTRQASEIPQQAVRLQLQPVENSNDLNKTAIPADLAYQTFLLTD